MTKRILSFILAVLTLFALCAPALASAEPGAAPAAPAEDGLEPETMDIPDAGVPTEEPAEQPGTEGPSGEPETTPEPEATSEPEPADLPSEEPSDEPEAAASSGWCGDDVRWSCVNGKLTISGTGPMYDYFLDDNIAPWFGLAKTVEIKQGVTYIGSCAFSGIGVEKITIPSSVKTIGSDAFYYCETLSKISIANGLTTIMSDAFFSCTNLTEISLPKSVAKIGSGAFDRCVRLKRITINNPDCTVQYDNGDTLGVRGTTTIVGHLGSTAHDYANTYGFSFEVIKTDNAASGSCGANGGNVKWTLASNGTLTISGKGKMADYYYTFGWDESSPLPPPDREIVAPPWLEYAPYITKAVIKNGVTSIGDYAFFAIFEMTSITIANSVTSIGESAFWSTHIASITLPNSVTVIEDDAFANCASLTSVSIPNSVTHIGEGVFLGCVSLTHITIPSSVAYLGFTSFYACNNLVSITILNPKCKIYGTDYGTIPRPESAVFYGYDGSTTQTYARENGFAFRSLGKAPGQKSGLVTENGKKYYYVNGVKQTGMKTVNGKTYYFSAKDGHMLTGLVTVDNKGHKCYFSAKDGRRLTGLVNTGSGIRYFSAKNGYMLKGLVTVDNKGHQCYFSAKNGYRLKGLVTTDNKGTKRFFSQSTGYMAKNQWVYVNGIRYYANAKGVVTRR